nr:hypothetical protein [uncultured Pseudomonas sp.]
MTTLCTVNDLYHHSRSKPFTMIPVTYLRHLQRVAEIGLDTFGMWLSLYDLCSSNPNMEREISWSFLAKRFGFSENTAKRLCRRLAERGLLEVVVRKAENGMSLPNVFRIRLSDVILAKLNASCPDRKQRGDALDGLVESIETSGEGNQAEGEIGAKPTGLSDSHGPEPTAFTQGELSASEGLSSRITAPAQTHGDGVFTDGDVKISCDDVKHACDTEVDAAMVIQAAAQREGRSLTAIERLALRSIGTKPKSKASEGPIQQPKGQAKLREAGNQVPTVGGPNLKRGGTKIAPQEITLPKEKTQNASWLFSIMEKLVKSGVASDRIPQLAKEVFQSLQSGALAKHPTAKAINIAAKLIRQGTWTTPRLHLPAMPA